MGNSPSSSPQTPAHYPSQRSKSEVDVATMKRLAAARSPSRLHQINQAEQALTAKERSPPSPDVARRRKLRSGSAPNISERDKFRNTIFGTEESMPGSSSQALFDDAKLAAARKRGRRLSKAPPPGRRPTFDIPGIQLLPDGHGSEDPVHEFHKHQSPKKTSPQHREEQEDARISDQSLHAFTFAPTPAAVAPSLKPISISPLSFSNSPKQKSQKGTPGISKWSPESSPASSSNPHFTSSKRSTMSPAMTSKSYLRASFRQSIIRRSQQDSLNSIAPISPRSPAEPFRARAKTPLSKSGGFSIAGIRFGKEKRPQIKVVGAQRIGSGRYSVMQQAANRAATARAKRLSMLSTQSPSAGGTSRPLSTASQDIRVLEKSAASRAASLASAAPSRAGTPLRPRKASAGLGVMLDGETEPWEVQTQSRNDSVSQTSEAYSTAPASLYGSAMDDNASDWIDTQSASVSYNYPRKRSSTELLQDYIAASPTLAFPQSGQMHALENLSQQSEPTPSLSRVPIGHPANHHSRFKEFNERLAAQFGQTAPKPVASVPYRPRHGSKPSLSLKSIMSRRPTLTNSDEVTGLGTPTSVTTGADSSSMRDSSYSVDDVDFVPPPRERQRSTIRLSIVGPSPAPEQMPEQHATPVSDKDDHDPRFSTRSSIPSLMSSVRRRSSNQSQYQEVAVAPSRKASVEEAELALQGRKKSTSFSISSARRVSLVHRETRSGSIVYTNAQDARRRSSATPEPPTPTRVVPEMPQKKQRDDSLTGSVSEPRPESTISHGAFSYGGSISLSNPHSSGSGPPMGQLLGRHMSLASGMSLPSTPVDERTSMNFNVASPPVVMSEAPLPTPLELVPDSVEEGEDEEEPMDPMGWTTYTMTTPRPAPASRAVSLTLSEHAPSEMDIGPDALASFPFPSPPPPTSATSETFGAAAAKKSIPQALRFRDAAKSISSSVSDSSPTAWSHPTLSTPTSSLFSGEVGYGPYDKTFCSTSYPSGVSSMELSSPIRKSTFRPASNQPEKPLPAAAIVEDLIVADDGTISSPKPPPSPTKSPASPDRSKKLPATLPPAAVTTKARPRPPPLTVIKQTILPPLPSPISPSSVEISHVSLSSFSITSPGQLQQPASSTPVMFGPLRKPSLVSPMTQPGMQNYFQPFADMASSKGTMSPDPLSPSQPHQMLVPRSPSSVASATPVIGTAKKMSPYMIGNSYIEFGESPELATEEVLIPSIEIETEDEDEPENGEEMETLAGPTGRNKMGLKLDLKSPKDLTNDALLSPQGFRSGSLSLHNNADGDVPMSPHQEALDALEGRSTSSSIPMSPRSPTPTTRIVTEGAASGSFTTIVPSYALRSSLDVGSELSRRRAAKNQAKENRREAEQSLADVLTGGGRKARPAPKKLHKNQERRSSQIGPEVEVAGRLGEVGKRGFNKTEIRSWLLTQRRESAVGLSGVGTL